MEKGRREDKWRRHTKREAQMRKHEEERRVSEGNGEQPGDEMVEEESSFRAVIEI